MFEGKTVAITGAAGGIGSALARELAGSGASVGLLDLDAEGLDRLEVELRAAGHRVLTRCCDIRHPEQCELAIADVVSAFGGLDVLINNAGITHRSLFRETDLEVIRRVMEVNYFGSVYCTRAALDRLVERRGVVVAISSVAGFAPLMGRTAYAASKHAIEGFFESLRSELADTGVDVLVVCPAFTDTTIESNALGGDGKPATAPWARVGRAATPQSVAKAVARAIARRRRRLVHSWVGKTSYWVSRVSPAIYDRLMRRSQREAFSAAETAPVSRPARSGP